MNWTEIVMLMLNLLLGGGFIAAAVTLKQVKEKAKTDVQKGNIELVNNSIKDLLESVKNLTAQNNELVDKLVNAERMNQHFQRKIVELEKKLKAFICISEELVRVFDKIRPAHLEDEVCDLKKMIRSEKDCLK
jgi:predicted RNase H-like nuclease (RuvC/YqgF family)